MIIDEAHELVSRVTGAASAELSPQMVERVARRALTYLEDEVALELLESAKTLRIALDGAALERVEDPDSPFVAACVAVRNAARTAVSALTGEGNQEPDKRQTAAAVKEVFDIAERMAELDKHDVVWVADRERFGREARVSPLSVAGLMRARVFGERTTVLTSATLKLGGDFTPIATSVGLKEDERLDFARQPSDPEEDGRSSQLSEPKPFPGAALMLARRLSIAGRASCTLPARCLHRGVTVCRTPRWPRSPSCWRPRTVGRLDSFLPVGPPRWQPSTPGSGCQR